MRALTHAVQPCVNKTTLLTYRESMEYHLGIQRCKQRPLRFCVCLWTGRRFLKPSASDFCSHSVFPDQKLLIEYWGSSRPPGDFLSTPVRMCIILHMQATCVGCKFMRICVQLACGSGCGYTQVVVLGTTYLMRISHFIYGFVCILLFFFLNEWMIYFLRAA